MRNILPISAILGLLALTLLLWWRFPYAVSSTEDKTHMLYSLILAIFISSTSLLHYRGRMSQLWRHALYWIVIIAAVTLGYSYRSSLLNNRLIATLIPTRATLSEDGKEVLFYASEGGHFFIEVTINGTLIQAMLDTGASDIILSPRDAHSIGFDTTKQAYSKLYHTANGSVMAAPVLLREISVGTISLTNIPASINSAAMDKSLIGMSFLKRLRSFSVEGDILRLRP